MFWLLAVFDFRVNRVTIADCRLALLSGFSKVAAQENLSTLYAGPLCNFAHTSDKAVSKLPSLETVVSCLYFEFRRT